jgi:hypothetical protein
MVVRADRGRKQPLGASRGFDPPLPRSLKNPLIPLPTPTADVAELLKAALNVFVAEEQALDAQGT